MAFYNLRYDNDKNLTDFEIYYQGNLDTDLYFKLHYHFNVNFYTVYHFSKTLGEKADEFIEELHTLQNDFYNFMFKSLETSKITYSYKKEECMTTQSPYEKDKKYVYDYFLPKQKEFANKWGLEVNCD